MECIVALLKQEEKKASMHVRAGGCLAGCNSVARAVAASSNYTSWSPQQSKKPRACVINFYRHLA